MKRGVFPVKPKKCVWCKKKDFYLTSNNGKVGEMAFWKCTHCKAIQ